MKEKSFAALRHPGFRSYFLLSALAMMADSVEHVISYWILFQKFHSPALGGFAMLSHWLPFLFFSVYSGALADRFDPRRIIQIGMALFMSASLGWGLLFGPAVGAGIMIVFGPAWGILLNVLIYVPLVLWLWKAPYGPKFRMEQAAQRALRGLADIAQALKEVAGNRVLVSMLLLAGGASLFVGTGYQAQMPEFAQDLGHGDPGAAYSMLLAADAAGALTAGLVLESRGLLRANPRTAFILAILWACAVAGFAASTLYELALVLLLVAGFLELSFNAMTQTLVQLHAPAAARGRVVGLYGMAALGMRAFSGVTIGIAGGLIGIHWSLALSAMAVLALTSGLLAFSLKTD